MSHTRRRELPGRNRGRQVAASLISTVLLGAAAQGAEPPPLFKQYCVGCHGKAVAMGGMNLEKLTADPNLANNYQQWLKVESVLKEKRMPPPKMKQPADEERSTTAAWIHSRLGEYIAKNAGDPGRVTVRRLTSAEYGYSIRDLTGLDLKFDRDFASDSVGGEGFTNFGDVQFMADANLESYLEAAKRVADHAVIGAGPLSFYDDPGKSGFELSAISRINAIYRANGFRSNAGEGGKPFGLSRYTDAYFVCWQYKHRAALGEPDASLESIAVREGVNPRFAQHILSVVQKDKATYPTSDVVAKWNAMPAPDPKDRAKSLAAGKAAADQVMRATIGWPRWLLAAGAEAEGGDGDERYLGLNNDTLTVKPKHHFRAGLRGRGKKSVRIYLSVGSALGPEHQAAAVTWKNAMVRVRGKDRGIAEAKPLQSIVDAESAKRFGPDGSLVVNGIVSFEIPLPEGAQGAGFEADVALADPNAEDAVLRCTVSDTEDVMKGIPQVVLLGNPKSKIYQDWKKNVLEYASLLPMNSQGEATPADKDPIPQPYNNVYNQPERDKFHAKVKYYRTDQFLYQHMLDDATRKKLDQAWDDLLASFDYHDTILRFTSEKFKFDLKKPHIADWTPEEIAALPAEPQKYVAALKKEYDSVQKAELAGRPGHINDVMEFAARAWRRPLTSTEKDRLRLFYTKATEEQKLDHGKAIETMIARVLVSPAFLYRLEQPAQPNGTRALSDWELASRLSYFLWSSVPDAELRRAASAGELSQPSGLEAQVKRMMADPKARRFATEFFGQWLGFYRFDQHRGVDAKRFPEFTDEVKSGMYDEAISFFEYIVRNNRPVHETLDADYTFLTKPLAKHYGVKTEIKSATAAVKVDNAHEFQRGGMLRLGAVLTATSAPLRTSPVKRGDWVLRRILGTPTPPPPADAGSIPADDKQFGGMSVKQRLEVHKRNATCASCHTRIDPLGFPLEKFDSVGRWRETYSDGKAIDDTSTLPDKTDVAGVDGLMKYLRSQEPQVLKTMSYKLVGYALGRTVQASDQPLIDKMTSAGGDATFAQLAAEIVTSKQFRYRREKEEPAKQPQQRISAVKNTSKEGGE